MKIGFIGAGNMGGSIIRAIVSNNIEKPQNIIVSDNNEQRLLLLAEQYGVNTSSDNRAAAGADIVFLCVKPNVIYNVISEISDALKDNSIVVSIAAGQSLDRLGAAFDNENVKLIRVMPNTPALVGECMAALSPNENVTDTELDEIIRIFESFGKAECVSESLMDVVTSVSGSSPAYVFMFIEAMADAAVAGGMPRAQAYTFAAQAVLGSAKMVLDTGRHPGELKDMVCSPGGTTIEAVAELERGGFRAAVINAMRACEEKSKTL